VGTEKKSTGNEGEPTIPQPVVWKGARRRTRRRRINIKRVASYSYYVISCQVTPSYVSFLNQYVLWLIKSLSDIIQAFYEMVVG
jgi:hypothetical protein